MKEVSRFNLGEPAHFIDALMMHGLSPLADFPRCLNVSDDELMRGFAPEIRVCALRHRDCTDKHPTETRDA